MADIVISSVVYQQNRKMRKSNIRNSRNLKRTLISPTPRMHVWSRHGLVCNVLLDAKARVCIPGQSSKIKYEKYFFGDILSADFWQKHAMKKLWWPIMYVCHMHNYCKKNVIYAKMQFIQHFPNILSAQDNYVLQKYPLR